MRLSWFFIEILLKYALKGLIEMSTFILVMTGAIKQQAVTWNNVAMDMLWENFQWILPLYMKPISFQSKASVVCSITTAISIHFSLTKLNVFSQHIGWKTNEYLNSAEQITRNWNVNLVSVSITSWDITWWYSINLLWKELMEGMSEHTGLISSYELLITAACTKTGDKMKGRRPREAD